MKDFIEVTMNDNAGKLIIAISSISMIEEYSSTTCRIVLKEKVEKEFDINLTVVLRHPILSVKKMIEEAQQLLKP